MLTAATNRDLIVMADFETGYWLWQYCNSLPPSPILDGQLPGYGVGRSIQIELHSWFEAGQQAFKAGMLDWHEFNSKGEELANSLADESMNRFFLLPQNSVGFGQLRLPGEQTNHLIRQGWQVYKHSKPRKYTISVCL